jgi:hypothetical protein
MAFLLSLLGYLGVLCVAAVLILKSAAFVSDAPAMLFAQKQTGHTEASAQKVRNKPLPGREITRRLAERAATR